MMNLKDPQIANVYEGILSGDGLRFAIVASRFNNFITEKLIDGARDGFHRHGADKIDIAWVPGTFEMPLVARRLAQSGLYHAICCLGAVIRGGTPHFEYISAQMTRGIAEAAWQSDVPIIFGVLTCDNIEQAIERAGTKGGNKGFDAAIAAIEMAQLWKNLPVRTS
ncbi:MAG: 6,7-dimethyl-8-ribityllumazine synthase [Deltaproteobacteria bacterium]|nr:6,7-dimethyl-8-ribityllumazine synthase [Deltaproteobacteria bacterium]